MHFSLPIIGSSKLLPTSSASSSSSSLWTPARSSPTTSKSAYLTHLVKRRRRNLFVMLCISLACLYYLYSLSYDDHSAALQDAPDTVLVVALDKSMSPTFSKRIVENRKRYAEKWGYQVFVKHTEEYDAGNEYNFKDGQGKKRSYVKTFNKLPVVRHAMASYPYSRNFWFLSSKSLIMNMEVSLEEHILNRPRLNSLMLRNQPVIPPQSIIHTFKRTDADDIQFIITQDTKTVKSDTFIVRRKMDEMPGKIKPGKTVFGYYLFDLWFDPLYRFYHFNNAETSALEHMVQWHPTVLAKLAIIPQRLMLSYPVPNGRKDNQKKSQDGEDDDPKIKYQGSGYEPGDFVVHFEGCGNIEKDKDCGAAFDRFYKMTEGGKGRKGKKEKE